MIFPIKPGSVSAKEVFRLKLKAERAAAAKDRPDAGEHAAANFMRALAPQPEMRVSIYYPINDELDTKPLGDALIDAGAKIGLPVVERSNAPLIFRAFERGDPLIDGRFGAKIPVDTAPSFEPEIMVIPLLGFDGKGGRLGYGGGFYDRTLSSARKQRTVIAVGYGFGAQEVDELPTSPLDQRLDWMVTERGAVKF